RGIAVMPAPAVHRKAICDPTAPLQPTITDPSPDTAVAMLLNCPPANTPRPVMPGPDCQRKACRPWADAACPAITEPSPETPRAAARGFPLATRAPRSRMPPAAVHAKARDEPVCALYPTIVAPSADTA